MTCSTNTCITYVHAKWHTDSMWWTDNQLVLLSHSLSFEQTRVSHRKRNRNRKVKMNLMEKQKSKGISTLKKNNYYSYKNITRGSPQNNVITTSCWWKKPSELQIYCVCVRAWRLIKAAQGFYKRVRDLKKILVPLVYVCVYLLWLFQIRVLSMLHKIIEISLIFRKVQHLWEKLLSEKFNWQTPPTNPV